VVVVVNAVWIARNGDYIQFDTAHHLNEAADFENTARSILRNEPGLSKLTSLVELLNNRAGLKMMWPRFVYAVSGLWSAVLGGGPGAPIQANVLFLGAWIAGAVLAMRRLLRGARRDPWEGAFYALMLGLLYPATYGPMRLYGLDFPLAGGICLSLALLMASRGFSRPWYAVGFGVVAGLSLLIKAHYAFYIGFAIPYALWMALRLAPKPDDERRWLRAVWLGVATAAVALLAWIWLAGSIRVILHDLAVHTFPSLVPAVGDSYTEPHSEAFGKYSLAWWTYYLRSGAVDLGIAGTVGLLIGGVSWGVRWKAMPAASRYDRRLLLCCAIGVTLALTIIPIKDTRYLFPVFPFYALVSAVGLMAMRRKPRRIVAVVLLVVGLVGWWSMSFDRRLSDRVHHELMTHVGFEEGNTWARAVGEERFPGLDDAVVEALEGRPGGVDAAKVAFLVVPQGIPMAGFHIDLARLDAYRMKRQTGCVGRKNPDLFSEAVLDPLCFVETIDMRFYDPQYFASEARTMDLWVVYHFHDSYQGFDPPYDSYYGEPMPEIVFSRTAEEIEQRLPEGLTLLGTHDYGVQAHHAPAVVYLYAAW